MKKQLAKTLKTLLGVLTCHLASLCLLFTPVFSTPVFGQLDTIAGVVQTAAVSMQQIQAQQAQAQAQAQTNAMMQSFAPQNQMVPSKFFPNCPVLKARTDFPAGVCEAAPALGDAAGAGQIMSVRDLAIGFDNHIANLLATNQNGAQPIGLQCLQDGMIGVEEQIINRMNELQALINQVKQETDLFKINNQEVIDGMDLLSSELYGKGPKNQDPRNPGADFTPQCQAVIGSANFLKAREGGLVNVQLATASINEKAAHAYNDTKTYTSQIESQLNQFNKRVKANGIGPFAGKGAAGIQIALRSSGATTEFKALNSLIESKLLDLSEDFTRYQSDLADVGFNVGLSELDHNFKSRYSAFSKNATSYFQKEAVSKCVNGSSGTLGTGLSTEQILASLSAPSLSGNATALPNLKAALRDVLNADGHIEDKMSAIQNLEERFGVGKIKANYTLSGSDPQSGTVYNLYKQQIAFCKKSIEQDKTYSASSIERLGGSYANRIKKADLALKKIINMERTFRTELVTALHKRAVNCEGIENTAEQCTMENLGDGGIMSPNHQNFCVKNAVNCASKVMTCQTAINNVVLNKKSDMKRIAGIFNQNVTAHVTKQKELLTLIKAKVLADANYIKGYYPGSSYLFPEDLFIVEPVPLMHEDYQVALRGKGDLSTLESLPKQLQKLKEMLEQQKDATKGVIAKYIVEVQDGMNDERKRWRKLADACSEAKDAYNQALAQSLDQQSKQEQEQKESTAADEKFCRRFEKLDNPAPNCGMVSLLSRDLDDVTSAVSEDAVAKVLDMEYQCDGVQNDNRDSNRSSRRGRSVASTPTSSLKKFMDDCGEDNDWEAAQAQLNGRKFEDEKKELLKRYSAATFKLIDDKFARINYCGAFGRTYNEKDNKCDDKESPEPNLCKYYAHVAHKKYGEGTLEASKEKYFEKYKDDDSILANDFLKDIVHEYQVAEKGSQDDALTRVGERHKGVKCLAQAEDNKNSGKAGGLLPELGVQASNVLNVISNGAQRTQ